MSEDAEIHGSTGNDAGAFRGPERTVPWAIERSRELIEESLRILEKSRKDVPTG